MRKVYCLFLLLPSLVAAREPAPSDWAAIQGMAAGERIEVQLDDNTMRIGPLDHATAEAVFLRRDGGALEIPRAQVWKICQRRKGHRGTWALIGGVAGAAAFGGIYGPNIESGPSKNVGAAAVGVVAVGAMAGAGAGYVIGRGKLEVIYHVPKMARGQKP